VIDLNIDMSNAGGAHQVSFSPVTALSADRKDKLKQARKIFDEYLDEDGNYVLPVGVALKKQIQEQLESQEFDDNLFDLVALEGRSRKGLFSFSLLFVLLFLFLLDPLLITSYFQVLQIVETDLVPKFLQSPSYISYQQQHTVQQQPPLNTAATSSSSSASSFFSFMTPRRKNSSTSSSSPSFSTTTSSSSSSATAPTATSTISSSFNLLSLLTSLSNSSTATNNCNSNVVNVTNPLYNGGGAHPDELESSPREPPTPSSSSSSVSQFTLNLNSTSNFSSGSSSNTLGSTPTSYTSTPRKFSFSSSKASIDAKSTKEHKKKEKKEKKEKKTKRHHRKGKEGGTEEDSSQQDSSQNEGPDRRELVGGTIVELLGEPEFELAYILCEATMKSQPSPCSFGSPRSSSSPPVSANNSSEDLMTGDAIEAILDLADTKCFAEDLIKQRLKLELMDLNRSPRQDGWLTVFREESVFTKVGGKHKRQPSLFSIIPVFSSYLISSILPKLVSKYFMLKGSNFMAVNVITPFVTTIAELGSLEIDLGDVEPSPTATANAEKLIQLATDFFITLCTTIPRFPA
jgi:hypothetical protein